MIELLDKAYSDEQQKLIELGKWAKNFAIAIISVCSIGEFSGLKDVCQKALAALPTQKEKE